MSIRVKRVYDEADCADGYRILVDRLWPRGLTKADARVDLWAKEAAPSAELRKWFAHDPAKWQEFLARYFAELDARPGDLASLEDAARHCTITLLYGARDALHNHALALKTYLETRRPAPSDT